MRITLEEVQRIAALAHLELDPAARDRLRSDLDQILSYVEKVNELDTDGVPPALGVTERGASVREDRPGACLSVEEALSNAPEPDVGQFKVPRVLPG
jgi:aspartyl-tRNA(Asn)/glutamyl-tRNA(Gln) amidotransferase subunit C